MPRRMFAAVTLATSLLLVGCNGNKQTKEAPPADPSVAAVPPAPEPVSHGGTITIQEPAPSGSTFTPQPSGAAVPGGTYTVKKGDTLSSISRQAYGTAARVKDIAAANNISDPNKIKVGQVLMLP
ncbi:MAG: LysM peptidoglycan-binding domain-containing protein [Phycisphaeraceae bacterium]